MQEWGEGIAKSSSVLCHCAVFGYDNELHSLISNDERALMSQPRPFADDFEASIRILRTDEGGRTTAPFNGIRWDFNYADELPQVGLYMIFPDFVDEKGNSLPKISLSQLMLP